MIYDIIDLYLVFFIYYNKGFDKELIFQLRLQASPSGIDILPHITTAFILPKEVAELLWWPRRQRSLHPASTTRVCLKYNVRYHPRRIHIAVRAALYAGGLAAAEATPGFGYALGEALLPDGLRANEERRVGAGLKKEKG